MSDLSEESVSGSSEGSVSSSSEGSVSGSSEGSVPGSFAFGHCSGAEACCSDTSVGLLFQ